jgi:hypothetical protein
MVELLGPAAHSLWTFGKTNPNVAMQTKTFATKTDFCRRLISENLRPVEYSSGLWNGVGAGTVSSWSLDAGLR